MNSVNELSERASSLRRDESSSRGTGSFALSIATLATVAVIGKLAEKVGSDVPSIALGVDGLAAYVGIRNLSLAGSYGRQADVIDAEVLRQEQVELPVE